MMAKGHHFPMLTLVGVVDADLGLAGGDLRATERTYQLLHQVAGRAGRAERTLEASFVARAWNPGEVRRLFASCGLAVEELRGDFGHGPFRAATSRRLVVVARRRARFVHRNRTGERKKR